MLARLRIRDPKPASRKTLWTQLSLAPAPSRGSDVGEHVCLGLVPRRRAWATWGAASQDPPPVGTWASRPRSDRPGNLHLVDLRTQDALHVASCITAFSASSAMRPTPGRRGRSRPCAV